MDEGIATYIYANLLDRVYWDLGGNEFLTQLTKALEKGFPIDYVPPRYTAAPERRPIRSLLHYLIDGEGFNWKRKWRKTEDEVREEYYDTLRFMLDNGANVNVKNKDGYNVLMKYVSTWGIKDINSFLPADIFEQIVAKTDDLNTLNTAFSLGAWTYIQKITDETDKDRVENADLIWKGLRVLLDYGADYSLDETQYAEPEKQERCRQLKRLIADYLEYKDFQKQDENWEFER